jgi:hypothetical protein
VVGVGLAALLAGSLLPATDPGPPEELGEVDGILFNESLSLTVADGLNESEREAFVARTMARVEVIRGVSFEERVDVEVITREEYREERNTNRSEAARVWENLRYQALFVVGQDRDASAVLDDGFAGNVQGYYSLGNSEIVIVSEGEKPTIDRDTLVHELVHALQDQRFGIDYDTETTDAGQGYESIVEGPAELVEERYDRRCGVEWSCIPPSNKTGGADLELGIELQILFPYVQGREFVDTVRQREGWQAVNDLHDRSPAGSTQVIHPETYPDVAPVNVTVTDRSTEAWSRFETTEIARRLGVAGERQSTDTLGEAAVYAMLLHNGVIDVEERLGYEHRFAAGWAGDQFVPYERDDQFGYVWKLAWESKDDAAQFASAYRQVLERNGALGTGETVFNIPDGPFEGAFRLTQEGSTVRIVSAPTEAALDEIHE